MNSFRNKVNDVQEKIGRLQQDYFALSETELICSFPGFPSARFHIGDYEIRNSRDIDKTGSGLIEFVEKRMITKRLYDLETNLNDTICAIANVTKDDGSGFDKLEEFCDTLNLTNIIKCETLYQMVN